MNNFESRFIEMPIKLATEFSPAVAVVYAVLLDVSHNNIAKITQEDIAYQSGITVRTVRTVLQKLENIGLIKRELNKDHVTSYYIKDIKQEEQPEQKTPAEVPAKQVEPTRQSDQQPAEQSKPKLKQGYQYYGEYEMIPLKPEEYKKLGNKFGRDRTDKYIEKMENWMLKRNSNRFDDYFGALSDWMMTDAQRLEQAQKSRQKYRPKLEGEQDPNWADEYLEVFEQEQKRLLERQEEIDKYIDLIN